MENLLVSVLGNINSGKSHTWNKLFGLTVRTGKKERRLYFNDCKYVKVFLQSLIGIRCGKEAAEPRVEEMREFIYGWAKPKNLVFNKC